MTIQYFVHCNCDYNEAMTHHASVRECYEAIRQEMRIELPVTDPGIGEAITDAYEAGNWKGLMIYRFDPQTAQITTVGDDELRAEINEAGEGDHASMSQVEYMAHGGQCCPLCRSREISGKSLDVDVLYAWQPVTCQDCGAEWNDLFRMTGYELTVEPTDDQTSHAALKTLLQIGGPGVLCTHTRINHPETNVLDLLTQITQPGESMTVRYTRKSDDTAELLVQPALCDDADLVTDEDALAARAALCRPVLFRGSHADVTACLTRYVQDNGDARTQLRDAYDVMNNATKDAAKRAAQAAATKQAAAKSKDKAKDKPAASTPETPTPPEASAAIAPKAEAAPATNPSSLF